MTVSCVEWAAKPLLQGWQLCSGMGGSFRLEWVAGLLWNRWQVSPGIRMLSLDLHEYLIDEKGITVPLMISS